MFPDTTLRLSREACVRDKGALPATIKLKDALLLAKKKYGIKGNLVCYKRWQDYYQWQKSQKA